MTSDPLPDPGSPQHKEMWQLRMREVSSNKLISTQFNLQRKTIFVDLSMLKNSLLLNMLNIH